MVESLIKVSQTSVKGQSYVEIPAGKTVDFCVVNKGQKTEQLFFTQYTVPASKTLKISVNIVGREE